MTEATPKEIYDAWLLDGGHETVHDLVVRTWNTAFNEATKELGAPAHVTLTLNKLRSL
jgi:hypothetical protein